MKAGFMLSSCNSLHIFGTRTWLLLLYSSCPSVCTYLSKAGSVLTSINPTFCPHGVLICLICISEQIATVALCSINWQVSVTQKQFVYCAVRTESASIIQVHAWRWRSGLVSGRFPVGIAVAAPAALCSGFYSACSSVVPRFDSTCVIPPAAQVVIHTLLYHSTPRTLKNRQRKAVVLKCRECWIRNCMVVSFLTVLRVYRHWTIAACRR